MRDYRSRRETSEADNYWILIRGGLCHNSSPPLSADTSEAKLFSLFMFTPLVLVDSEFV